VFSILWTEGRERTVAVRDLLLLVLHPLVQGPAGLAGFVGGWVGGGSYNSDG